MTAINTLDALVQPVPVRELEEFERRASERNASGTQALSRPLIANDAIAWGASVRDVSDTGIGLTLCFPFNPGTYLAIDLRTAGGTRSLLARVVHARDQADGTWHVGCEFVNKLSENDQELMN